jgi:uncharacterized protein YuzE
MEEGKVRAWYDKAVDILCLLFKEGPSQEVTEADPDVHLELDENGKITGIEMWNARKSRFIKQVARAITETAC